RRRPFNQRGRIVGLGRGPERLDLAGWNRAATFGVYRLTVIPPALHRFHGVRRYLGYRTVVLRQLPVVVAHRKKSLTKFHRACSISTMTPTYRARTVRPRNSIVPMSKASSIDDLL